MSNENNMADVSLKDEDDIEPTPPVIQQQPQQTAILHEEPQINPVAPPSPPPPAPGGTDPSSGTKSQQKQDTKQEKVKKQKQPKERSSRPKVAMELPKNMPAARFLYLGFCLGEIILGILILICISSTYNYGSGFVYFTCISGIVLGSSRLYFHILRHFHTDQIPHFLTHTHNLSWLLSGIVFYGIWTFLYLVAAIMQAADSARFGGGGTIVACILCWISWLLYGLGAAYYFLSYRKELPPSAPAGAAEPQHAHHGINSAA